MTLKKRAPAVSGMFYPESPLELTKNIVSYLSLAEKQSIIPKAIIVPHAGYIYSAQVAAQAYSLLKPSASKIKKVVLLGPSHRVGFRGIALTDADVYETPLGDVVLDKTAFDSLKKFKQVHLYNAAHKSEHSLEVHLPFLQVLLKDFELLPLVIGEASPKDVSDVLIELWGSEETLIVISTDLSHFESYEVACEHDKKTCELIEKFRFDGFNFEDACGRIPVSGMLLAAQKMGLQIKTLDLKNSGDTAGTKDKVVGYGAWVLF